MPLVSCKWWQQTMSTQFPFHAKSAVQCSVEQECKGQILFYVTLKHVNMQKKSLMSAEERSVYPDNFPIFVRLGR